MKHEGYNCFGYAVGRKKWLIMRSWRAFVRDYNDFVDYFTAKDNAVKELYQRYGLKHVDPRSMELGKEYVAYKFGLDDFHFALRNKQGYWRHKSGDTQAKPISEEHVFAEEWYFYGNQYDSETILFEKP